MACETAVRAFLSLRHEIVRGVCEWQGTRGMDGSGFMCSDLIVLFYICATSA